MLPLLKLQYSKKLFSFAVFLYSGAGISIVICALPWFCKFLLLAILMLNAKYYFPRYIFLSHPRSVMAMWKSNPAFWSLQMANQQMINGLLCKNSLVTHFLIVLNFSCEDNLKQTVIITPESIGFQEFRRLFVHLAHTKHDL